MDGQTTNLQHIIKVSVYLVYNPIDVILIVWAKETTDYGCSQHSVVQLSSPYGNLSVKAHSA